MIKDYQNKEVLAEMKRQVNAAAKISDREARITFVLIHMISEYHILAEHCTKPDGENNLFRFISWCLSRFAEELEMPSNEEFTNPTTLLRYSTTSFGVSLKRFFPSTVSFPADGRSSPPRILRSVDFPEPEFPTIAMSSPYSTSRSNPWSASTSRSRVL